MEWSKEKLEGTCVLIKSVSQSNRILKFYQSFGYFEQTKQNWECPKSMVGTFIGPSILDSNDIVHIYCSDSVSGLQIIKLPVTPRRKFPREMMVSNDKVLWVRKIVAAKTNTPFPYACNLNNKFEGNEIFPFLLCWRYAKEID